MVRKTPMALILACSVGASAYGQEQAYYSFTSGPEGDGFNWPKSQITKPAGSAFNSADFVTPDSPLTLGNLSGNPAYFNSNNLLTRPASLISRDAWWTDPRWYNYGADGQFASLIVQFQRADGGSTEVLDFGFDMAFASVSNALPLGLDYQITDTLGNVGFGYMSFAGSFPEDQGYDRTNYSSFNTLGSVYGGKQARFRFDVQELLANVLDEPPDLNNEDTEFGFYGLEYMYISLSPLVTNGGTSQIVMDNFVINGALVEPPPPAPVYVAPTYPLPDTTIYIFDYTDADAEGYVDLGDEDLAAISITSGTDESPFSATAQTTSTTVVFNSEPGTEVLSHEMSHNAQSNAPGPDGRVDVGSATVTVNTQDESSLIDTFAVEIQTHLNPELTPDPGLRQDIESSKVVIETVTEIVEAQHRASMQVIQNLRSFSEMSPTDEMMLVLSVAEDDPGFAYYQNYSLLDYIDLKDAQGEAWNVGDQGSVLAPVLGDDQEIVSYILTTWLITDESGTFVQSMAVPEPGSLALLGLGGLLLGRRRRD